LNTLTQLFVVDII